MVIDPIEWNDDLNLGIEKIDKAYQNLFSVVRKIANLLRENDEKKNRFACEEAVKYLLSYTIWHFNDEEEYQRQTGYPDYKMHKHLHDNLRDVILPSLIKDFEEHNYDNESVSRFVYILAGWLTGHIMIEDMAIVGKTNTKYDANVDPLAKIKIIDTEFVDFMKRIFQMDVELFDSSYAGTPLKQPSCYQMIFANENNGKKVRMTMIIEESMILALVSKILETNLTKADKNVYRAYVELAQKYAYQLLNVLHPSSPLKKISHKYLSLVDLQYCFKEKLPTYALLWKAPNGFIGFCYRELDD